MSHPLNTVNRRFAEAIEKYSDRPALSSKISDKKKWNTFTYREVNNKAKQFSLGLRSLDIERGDRVAMLSENRPEWAIADLATLASGAVTVPIYPTLPPSQVAHILSDSGAKAIVVSDAKQMEKVINSRANFPNLSIFITMDESSAKGDILSFEAVILEGKKHGSSLTETYETRRDSVEPDDLMSLVYTSGTTGNPKGAMLSHGNMVAALDGAANAFPFYPPNETFLSFLPLCHVFERVTYCLALTLGAHTYYNDSIFKLMENMQSAKPTIMQCVPRVYESIHERIIETLSKESPKKQWLVHWSLGVGDTVATRKNAGKFINPVLRIKHIVADKIVLTKIRARFGGHIKFFVSGGAPLNPITAQFFNAIGIPIVEGWGLTETTAASTINPVDRIKVGTVGIAGFGAEVSTAPDGEILVRGPHIMHGYWNNPEATAEVIDKDRWFHTGDIGDIDKDGYLKITDRKKDIIVLANGKKVAPQPIETNLKHNPYISEVVLLGDQAGTISALVVPNYDHLKKWAKEQGIEKLDSPSLAVDPAVRKFIKTQVDKNSGELADFEKIKRIALLDKSLSVDDGELTPTLKVKRKVVSDKYSRLLDRTE